jgi:ribonuclease R
LARRKKSRDVPSGEALLDHLKSLEAAPSRRDLARAFGLKGEERAELRRLLRELEEGGRIARTEGRIAQLDKLPPVAPVDVMSVDEDGDLVCMPANWLGDSEPPMIRVAARKAAAQKPPPGVGDRLLARLTPAGDEGYEADIIRAIGRGAHRFLAVFRKTRAGGTAEPVERRTRQRFEVARGEDKGAKDGDLVWIEARPARTRGAGRARVREIAGHIDDRASFSMIALASHGVPTEFAADVLAEAANARAPALQSRADLRDLPLVTIDPEDAKDHDDAVFAAPDEHPDNDGGFRIIVAIADVSWFIAPDGPMDREAEKRGNSVYLPDRVVPMLPERLSNDLCSLRDGVDRACLAVEMRMSKSGRKISHRFMRALMRSAAKLSYGAAQEIIDGGKAPAEIAEVVRCLHAAFRARGTERSRRAPLDLDLPERKVILNERAEVVRVERRERFDAHRLIEEFMILANIAAAETLEERKTPRIYRVHDAPDPEKLDALREYLDGLGYSLAPSGAIRPANFNQLLKIAGERGEKEMVSEVVLRAQRQAAYATENLGHFGLNIARYAHFTSPIRRYADLTVHRALVAALKLGRGAQTEKEAARLPLIAERISEAERRAMAVERESTDRYLAAFLEKRVGEEFDARIRGVTRFGLFVALDETGADGFVPVQGLGPERFEYVESRHALVGARTGGFYQLGQKVRVRLQVAAPITGGMRFEMASEPQAGERPQVRRKGGPTPRGDARAGRRGKPPSRRKGV